MMEAAKGFSLLIDGTTDFSGYEQECVFVRAAINGHDFVQESFLTIGSPSSTTAGDLKAFVDDVLVENGLEKEKLIGLGYDGAANMVGVRNGLAAKLKQDIGVHFVNIHCFNRLELAWHDTI
ncbi:uncharacterized protein LOC127852260 [Dreissena polymorpha]|uniref:uncharacterized protein LOC127852260 n=1 Tax=Dreissena polymorpha TaxID=45954 RepID=UPI0022653C31|nr:uncharacterized protein LOC127852260 [Dreissena polymorpha]